MLVVVFNDLEMVYGFSKRRLCRYDVFWDFFTRNRKELLIFRFWSLGYVFRAYSWDVRLGLKHTEGHDDGVRYEGCSKPAM